MAYKSATAKQQDISRTRAHLRETANAFNAATAQCIEHAAPEAVHAVRTRSRRLEAMLESMLRNPAAVFLERHAQAWLRRLKRVRRAAGQVRDLDVHRKLLEPLLDPQDSVLSRQAAQLDSWLKSRRKQLGSRMQKQIEKRRHALGARQSAFFIALQSTSASVMKVPGSTDLIALEQFIQLADTMPLLDAENLHDFRKATKKARYVAESGAEAEQSSSVAQALKQVQDAIGDWHDWLCLSQEANVVLGKDATELSSWLSSEVEKHYRAAITTVNTMRGRLSGEWMASMGKRPSAQEKMKQHAAASGF